jgi:hypothetical protein
MGWLIAIQVLQLLVLAYIAHKMGALPTYPQMVGLLGRCSTTPETKRDAPRMIQNSN